MTAVNVVKVAPGFGLYPRYNWHTVSEFPMGSATVGCWYISVSDLGLVTCNGAEFPSSADRNTIVRTSGTIWVYGYRYRRYYPGFYETPGSAPMATYGLHITKGVLRKVTRQYPKSSSVVWKLQEL